MNYNTMSTRGLKNIRTALQEELDGLESNHATIVKFLKSRLDAVNTALAGRDLQGNIKEAKHGKT